MTRWFTTEQACFGSGTEGASIRGPRESPTVLGWLGDGRGGRKQGREKRDTSEVVFFQDPPQMLTYLHEQSLGLG